MNNRKYMKLNCAAGYPVASRILYECGICSETMPSMPEHAAACKCRNVIVDSDAERIAVKDSTQLKAYESID